MAADKDGPPGAEARLAALGRVMGELVHDLNNEVTVLQGWAILARGELDAGRLPADEMDRVVGITDHLAQMLRDMLDTVAGRALSPEVTFDPFALTEQLLGERVRGLGGATLHLHSSLAPDVRVPGRASFWVRALSNLLVNGTRHARSQIRISLGHAPPREGGDQVVVLRVEDDGPGIPPEDRTGIFDPFRHGGVGGTGLGLSSVAWSAMQLGGSAAYREDSSLGGAAFEVRVPAAPRSRSAPRARAAAADLVAIRGSRILVVDDDAAVRSAVRCLLQRAGVEVRDMDPLGEPEDHVLQAILSSVPDVVLLDLRLGERGGLAVWSRMCLAMPHLASRVIFVSGAAPGDPDWEEARRTGQPLLGKPFDVRELARLVLRLQAGQ